MNEKLAQAPGSVPSLVNGSGPTDKSQSVSILRDLDPAAAKLSRSDGTNSKLLLPLLAFLLAGGGAAFWLSSNDTQPVDATEPARRLADAPAAAQHAASEKVAAVTPAQPSEPAGGPAGQGPGQAEKPAQVAGVDSSAGPATIISMAEPAASRTQAGSANPLSALTESSPAVTAEGEQPATKAKAQTGEATKSKAVSSKKRSQRHPVIAKAKKQPPKTAASKSSSHLAAKGGSAASGSQPSASSAPSRRDIDIFTAIVRDE